MNTKVAKFRLPNGNEFSIPLDWLADAGVGSLFRGCDCYVSASSDSAKRTICNIDLPLGERPQKDHEGFDRARMVSLFNAIVSGVPIPPVEVMEWPGGTGRYLLADGYHRFFASVAVGFERIPTVEGWVFEHLRP